MTDCTEPYTPQPACTAGREGQGIVGGAGL